ncbi:MAG: polysaccharide pyruvyl transferase family protein, partial [Deltaproteobacteria bacterium]|nr:polysaccharide pyruvyl transferase family protein [Deltaproteobacteria bacterium]
LLTAEQWQDVAVEQPVTLGRYVLLYDLLPSAQIVQLARRIAAVNNAQVVRLCRSAGMKPDPDILSLATAGPAEFIRAFADAAFVVTNSFHGTVFSLLFNKPFYTVTPTRMKNAGRMQSLLELVGLSSRLCGESEIEKISLECPIDYSPINDVLAAEREKSVAFLTDALTFTDINKG